MAETVTQTLRLVTEGEAGVSAVVESGCAARFGDDLRQVFGEGLQRRYASAQELAEELGRYSEG